MTTITGTELRLLHLILDLEEGDIESIQSMGRTVEEERLVTLEIRGLVDVRVTAAGKRALKEHYARKDGER